MRLCTHCWNPVEKCSCSEEERDRILEKCRYNYEIETEKLEYRFRNKSKEEIEQKKEEYFGTRDTNTIIMNYWPAIDIDDNIAEAISLFNQKGYHTSQCCSGHWKEEDHFDNPVIYISFRNTEDILNAIKSNEQCLFYDNSLWSLSLNKQGNECTLHYYASIFSRATKVVLDEEVEKELKEARNQILEFAKSIPNLKEEK